MSTSFDPRELFGDHDELLVLFARLTRRQQAFVAEYVVRGNGAEAARRAGYSPRRAKETAARLVTDGNIRGLIDAGNTARLRSAAVRADDVVRELAALAFSRLGDVADWGPDGVTVRSSEGLSEATVAAVSEVRQSDTRYGRNVRVKLHDKVHALYLLGRRFRLWEGEAEERPTARSPSLDRIAAVMEGFSDAAVVAAIRALGAIDSGHIRLPLRALPAPADEGER